MRTVGLIFDDTGQSVNAGDVVDLAFDRMSLSQLKEFAVQSGIDFPPGAKKAELLDIVRSAFEGAMPG